MGGSPQKKMKEWDALPLFAMTFRWNYSSRMVPQGQTVNSAYHYGVMKRLRGGIGKKRSDLWQNGSRVLLQDNASAQIDFIVRDLFVKTASTILNTHSAHQIWLSATFFYFPK